VRVEDAADSGTVKISLAFEDWKAGKVKPATIEIPFSAKDDREK
jgi:hypothetical protein